MKKIVKLSLLFLLIMCIMSNVYAILNCNIDIIPSKTEYSKGEEFTVSINLINVNSDKGIITLGGTLDYDKSSLTLVKMEGKNGWQKPSYNDNNGKFVMDRDSITKSDETILAITFKVNETSKKNLTISLKDVSISDGNEGYKISREDENIIVKDGAGTSSVSPNQNTNKNTSTNTNSGYKNGTLPKTGESDIVPFLVISFTVFVMTILFSVVKIRMINKEDIEK